MKRNIRFALLICVVVAFFSSCGVHTFQVPSDIQVIMIGDGPQTTFQYTSEEKIQAFQEYFSSLKLYETDQEKVKEKDGMSWSVTLQSRDETEKSFSISDTLYDVDSGYYWALSENQWPEFDQLLRDNIPDVLPETILFEEWKN